MNPDPSSPHSPDELCRLAEACLRERECSPQRPHGDVRAYTYSEALVVMVAFAEWLQLDQQPLKARLAQLAQEQAELRTVNAARLQDWNNMRLMRDAAEAALGEIRQALQQLYLAARQTLSALDRVDISGGTTIWIKEREQLDAALARVDQTGVPREDSVPRPPVGETSTDR